MTTTSTLEFNSTVSTLRPKLVRFVARLVGDADAEDVVQIALSKASNALSDFRGEATLRAWLFRIARNAAHDFLRARKSPVHEMTDAQGEEDDGMHSQSPSQDRRVEQQQMSVCVNDVYRRLPGNYQEILALSDMEELSDRETAAILDVTVGTAKIRLHRARAALKEALESACSFYRDDQNTLCCDKKQDFAKDAYPFGSESRHQGKRRENGTDAEPLKEEFPMNKNEILSTKQKHLIGAGASVAAGCRPCTTSYVTAAKAEGACERGVRLTIERGLEGLESAASAMTAFADKTFAKPEIDATFRAGRALLDALIGVAAAVASSASARVASCIKKAQETGATDAQIRMAIEIARTVRRGAESETEATVADALGETPQPRCCEGGSLISSCSPEIGSSADGAAKAADTVTPCGCGTSAKKPA